MATSATQKIINQLEAVGLTLKLNTDYSIQVTPASILTNEWRELIRENKTKIVEFLNVHAANDSEIDRWCWPFSDAMNTRDIDTFFTRLSHFVKEGMSQDDAERLADTLVYKDRGYYG